MTLLLNTNARMALESIRSNKLRSLLTMLGIIIGVSSVILTVSLGEGIRRQVANTDGSETNNLLTVRSGRIVTRDKDGNINQVNYLASFGSNSLTQKDLEALQRLPEAENVVPLGTISGLPTNYEKEEYRDATIIATSSQLPAALDQKIAYGNFFDDETNGRNIAIIGQRVAEELFKENVPLGKLLTIRDQDFVVGGIFEEFESDPLNNVADLNNAIFISYNTARLLIGGNPSIYQFFIAPKDGISIEQLATASQEALLETHGGQEDFTILRPNEAIVVARDTLAMATAFVAGIAAISLIVGGIGIMNIMFVSVTERTREIGVRKSLGATNKQIYSQFLIEAGVLSVVGGIVGVLIAVAISAGISVTTDLQPTPTWQIILLAVGVSGVVGIIFGTAPAIKAARKDPIESLRYE